MQRFVSFSMTFSGAPKFHVTLLVLKNSLMVWKKIAGNGSVVGQLQYSFNTQTHTLQSLDYRCFFVVHPPC